MPDRRTQRMRRLAAAARREAALARATVRAYNRLLAAMDPLLRAHNYDPSVLDDRLPAWRDTVDEELVPEVTAAYIAGLEEAAREGVTVDAQAYAARYLATAQNRLVGVSDYVADTMHRELRQGMLEGEGIPELAARVDALLEDGQRWRNRATVVARTEVVGAMNAGHADAAEASAAAEGVPRALVAKEWLATSDSRTRPHHREADGQMVVGLDTHFRVGAALMLRPHDPEGGPDEVIQCRCAALYHLPGDPDYPEDLEGIEATTSPMPRPAGYVEPVTAADPTTMALEDLDAEMADLMAAGDYGDRFTALAAAMDARESAAPVVELPAAPDPLAEQRALNLILFGSEEPADYTPKRRRNAEDKIRDEYDTWVHTQWLRAEEECRGSMLSAEGHSKGVDVLDLFTRRLRSLKYASPELQEWFAQPGNQRLSFLEFRAGITDDKYAREADARRRNRGWESEWG